MEQKCQKQQRRQLPKFMFLKLKIRSKHFITYSIYSSKISIIWRSSPRVYCRYTQDYLSHMLKLLCWISWWTNQPTMVDNWMNVHPLTYPISEKITTSAIRSHVIICIWPQWQRQYMEVNSTQVHSMSGQCLAKCHITQLHILGG